MQQVLISITKIKILSILLKEESVQLLNDSLQELLIETGERGFMTVIGIRQTTGSINFIPPSKELLVFAFMQIFSTELNKKTQKLKSYLSAGAKALSKHSVRSVDVNFLV